MAPSVQVVANDQIFDVPESVHNRWPEDYPLASTTKGKPTAAARRAKKPELPPLPAPTTKTAADLLAGDPNSDGEPAGDTTQKGAD